MTREAERDCLREVGSATTGTPRREEIEAFYLHPTEDSWASDDREVLCIALFSPARRGEL